MSLFHVLRPARFIWAFTAMKCSQNCRTRKRRRHSSAYHNFFTCAQLVRFVECNRYDSTDDQAHLLYARCSSNLRPHDDVIQSKMHVSVFMEATENKKGKWARLYLGWFKQERWKDSVTICNFLFARGKSKFSYPSLSTTSSRMAAVMAAAESVKKDSPSERT